MSQKEKKFKISKNTKESLGLNSGSPIPKRSLSSSPALKSSAISLIPKRKSNKNATPLKDLSIVNLISKDPLIPASNSMLSSINTSHSMSNTDLLLLVLIKKYVFLIQIA